MAPGRPSWWKSAYPASPAVFPAVSLVSLAATTRAHRALPRAVRPPTTPTVRPNRESAEHVMLLSLELLVSSKLCHLFLYEPPILCDIILLRTVTLKLRKICIHFKYTIIWSRIWSENFINFFSRRILIKKV